MPALKKVSLEDLAGQQEVTRAACYVYVVSETGSSYYKIGIASHPRRRLSSLQCGNPRPLELVCAFEGSRANCARAEFIALRFFRARSGSEWLSADCHGEVIELLSAFEVPE